MNIMEKQRKGPSGQQLADLATLPPSVVKVVRA